MVRQYGADDLVTSGHVLIVFIVLLNFIVFIEVHIISLNEFIAPRHFKINQKHVINE